MKLKMIQMAM